jgi:hypothetical protein
VVLAVEAVLDGEDEVPLPQEVVRLTVEVEGVGRERRVHETGCREDHCSCVEGYEAEADSTRGATGARQRRKGHLERANARARVGLLAFRGDFGADADDPDACAQAAVMGQLGERAEDGVRLAHVLVGVVAQRGAVVLAVEAVLDGEDEVPLPQEVVRLTVVAVVHW